VMVRSGNSIYISTDIIEDTIKLETQWAEPVSLTCRSNQKQELPIAAMFVNGMG
jgi:hypothetical protein